MVRTAPHIPRPALALHLLVLASGLAGLGYELLWTRQLATSLGHEIPATLAVVSAFFAGLALGGWVLDDPIRRATRPGLWYAALEGAIGLWCLVLLWLLPAAAPWTASLVGIDAHPLWQWAVFFGLPLLLLLPSTVAMGATLPAAVQMLQALRPGPPAWAGSTPPTPSGPWPGSP
jgi:spermidine synthase